jgi:hypothetical protein
MKKVFIVIVILLTNIFHIYAQTQDLTAAIANAEFQAKQVIPPSPIAAELGKYGNVPISLFTGTPNVSIPLCELKGNLLSLPVSLSYNASGFKPEELASWVGSGWSLNAGGVVTRSVLGNPDISVNYFNAEFPLTPPDNLDIFPYYNFMNNVQSGLLETQPDIYYYNFTGHTGKFLLNPDQSVFKKKRDMLIITSGILSTPSNFSITDDHGIQYIFSDSETTTLIPNDAGQSSGGYVFPSSWFLTKMKTADDNEEIDFDYYTTSTQQTMNPNDNSNQFASYTFESGNYEPACKSSPSINGGNSVPPTSLIIRKFLKRATLYKGGVEIGYVDFISSVGNRQDSGFSEDRILNQVILYSVLNGIAQPVKQYNLTYSYFVNGVNKMLRLDAVQEVAIDSQTASVPPYQFTYNTTIALPDRFTMSIDHWGFFNNSGNTSLVPSQIVFGDNGGLVNAGKTSNREPSLAGSSCTLLNKIQYPTGGYTTFDYELNAAKNSSNTLQYIGGVRIQRITDFSSASQQAITKTYSYLLDDNTTSGVANFPTYLQTTLAAHVNEPCIGQCTPCQIDYNETIHTTYTVSSNSIYGLGMFQGSQVGYTQVTETQNDVTTGQPLGKTVYKYNVALGGIAYNDGHDDDISNGDLAEQTDYRSDGLLLKDVTNTMPIVIWGLYMLSW